MIFFKHHKKVVAFFVALSFLFLLEASSLPLGAEPAATKAPVSMSGNDQAPDSFEQEGSGNNLKKKHSALLPIIIGIAAVGAIAAVLILVVFKTKHDIRGIWYMNLVREGPYPDSIYTLLVFSGTKKSGMVMIFTDLPGQYTVDGKSVSFYFMLDATQRVEFNCTFTAKNQLEGSWQNLLYPHDYYGTWTATKVASTARPKNQANNLSPKHIFGK
jgi:hypothetical protein